MIPDYIYNAHYQPHLILEQKIRRHKKSIARLCIQQGDANTEITYEQGQLSQLLPATVEVIMRHFGHNAVVQKIKINILHQNIHRDEFCGCMKPIPCRCYVLELDRMGNFLDAITGTPIPIDKVKGYRAEALHKVKETPFGRYFFDAGGELKPIHKWRLTQ